MERTVNGLINGATYKFINRASGMAIDVPDGQNTNALQLQQYTDNGASAQQWVITDQGTYNNFYKLTSVSSSDGKVMDVRGGTSNNGEAIQLMQSYNNTEQQFRLIKLSNGYYSIINVNSNKAVEVAECLYIKWRADPAELESGRPESTMAAR